MNRYIASHDGHFYRVVFVENGVFTACAPGGGYIIFLRDEIPEIVQEDEIDMELVPPGFVHG